MTRNETDNEHSEKFAALNLFKKHSHEEIINILDGTKRLVEHFEGSSGRNIPREHFAQMLSCRLNDGEDYTSALMNTKEEVYRFPGVVQPLDSIQPSKDNLTTIEVTVLERIPLQDHAADTSLAVVDESDKQMNLLVWNEDKCETINKGDTVRINNVIVDMKRDRSTGLLMYNESTIEYIDED